MFLFVLATRSTAPSQNQYSPSVSASYGHGQTSVISISGQGTMASNKARIINQDESNASALMDKIQFYTTELHRMLDMVDKNKKSSKAR